MAQTKLISIRLDEKILAYIDAVADKHTYLDRSKVIARLLSAMVQCCEYKNLMEVLNCYDPYSDGISIEVKQKNTKIGG